MDEIQDGFISAMLFKDRLSSDYVRQIKDQEVQIQFEYHLNGQSRQLDKTVCAS